MPDHDATADRMTFGAFYRDHFLAEHVHPVTIALHVGGTIASAALIVAALSVIPLWWALLYPVVHVVPGLIGHRLFDRNDAVGDIRVLRTDFPLHWFIAANHKMTARVLTFRQP